MLDTNTLDLIKTTINIDSLQAVMDSIQAVNDSLREAKEFVAKQEGQGLFLGFVDWIKNFTKQHGSVALLYGGGSVLISVVLWFYNKGRKSSSNQIEKLYNSMININNTVNNNQGVLINKIDAVDNKVGAVKNDVGMLGGKVEAIEKEIANNRIGKIERNVSGFGQWSLAADEKFTNIFKWVENQNSWVKKVNDEILYLMDTTIAPEDIVDIVSRHSEESVSGEEIKKDINKIVQKYRDHAKDMGK